MRLIHLTSSGGWGGREMYPASLAAAQAGRGHTVSLVAKKNTPLSRFLASSSLDHDLLRVGPYIDPAAALELCRIIKLRKPEVIQVHLSRDLALVSLACRLARLRPALILHKHIASAGNKKDLFHRYLYGRLSAVVAVSEFVKRSLVASCPIEPGRVRVIFNGVDIVKFRAADRSAEPGRSELRRELGAVDEETRLVGVVGRLDPRKGQQWLIQAAARLGGSVPELRCVLIGASEGDYRSRLEREVETLGLGGKVLFCGYREEVRDIFSALDILVVPSFEEAFGLVAVEGMLSGLPVIAAASGALPEFIEDGATGLLVEQGNVEALAGILERLAGDKELRSALGSRGRAWAAQNLSLERVLGQLDDLYQECLAGGR